MTRSAATWLAVCIVAGLVGALCLVLADAGGWVRSVAAMAFAVGAVLGVRDPQR